MATDYNCSACDELRQSAPNFVINGLGDDECTSLKNNTGLDPSSGHKDCKDLNNMNDCLIASMENEVPSYQICDWKSFMKDFIPNLWTMIKGLICAICGIWTKLNCTYNSLVKLVNYLADTTAGVAFVKYYRDLGSGEESVPYWDNITDGFERTLNIYMNSHGMESGNKSADRDYVVMISNCTNLRYFGDINARVTFYSSGEDDSTEGKRATIRSHKGQHPSVAIKKGSGQTSDDYFENFSWTTSGAVLVKSGEHVKVNFHVSDADAGAARQAAAPSVRLHQFVLTWIPVNVSEALDPSDILEC